MRIPRIYTSQDLSDNSSIELSEEASHYILKVLRMTTGRSLVVFNGSRGEYAAEITHTTKRIATIQTHGFTPRDIESPIKTHLAIALSRGERFDWAIQKATELGVTEITPILSERTEVKVAVDRADKKLLHWRGICISACEQSGRNSIPKINPLSSLYDYVTHENNELKFVLHHRSDKKMSDYKPSKTLALLVGPEGGLSEQEIQHATESGFHPLTLGPRVLRTETAPIAALAAIQTLWGDF